MPERVTDPYVENEIKGTRMPDCSIVAKCRDIFGELGWIPNFNVVKSKNNTKRHTHYREYFDAPRDYHNEFIIGAKTSDP